MNWREYLIFYYHVKLYSQRGANLFKHFGKGNAKNDTSRITCIIITPGHLNCAGGDKTPEQSKVSGGIAWYSAENLANDAILPNITVVLNHLDKTA